MGSQAGGGEGLHLSDKVNLHAPLTSRRISDVEGRRYLPELGWFDPGKWRLDGRGPRPGKEMTWFARQGDTAFGAEDLKGAAAIHEWDMKTGCVRHVCDMPDSQIHSCNLTRSGRIVAVNVYGVFYRFDAMRGALELTRVLPTDAVSYVDCLCRMDEDRLLGTTFITQRFWEANIKTGHGMDCGRAAPEWGEVTQTWKVGRKVYMAAYIGGELVEYDPSTPPRYPENPRVQRGPATAGSPLRAMPGDSAGHRPGAGLRTYRAGAKRASDLDGWIARTGEIGAPREVRAFADALLKDEAAVRAALSLPWSNGQVEGQVNRLNLIKRMMYGRGGFELLRRRVLHRPPLAGQQSATVTVPSIRGDRPVAAAA